MKREIEIAKSVDLVRYCQDHHIPLGNEQGRNPHLAEFDSLVFFPDSIEGQWHRFSDGTGGDAIAFIEFYHDLPFVESVKHLNEYVTEEECCLTVRSRPPDEPVFQYDFEKDVKKTDRIFDYLCGQRQIHPDLVQVLVDKRFLKQDQRNNIVFRWADEGEIVGASLQGTAPSKNGERSFKGIMKNSTSREGFNVKTGTPTHLKFFESPIDLLSYYSLCIEDGQGLSNHWLVSMEGLKRGVIMNFSEKAYLETGVQPESLTLCVDNDEAGWNFANELRSQLSLIQSDGSTRPIEVDIPEGVKDWNDVLCERKNGQMDHSFFRAEELSL